VTEVSVIVPTYQEVGNIPELTQRVFRAVGRAGFKAEMIIVDDDSQDGTEIVCAEMATQYPLRLITRKHERGLATAVLHGIRHSAGEIIVVMDADLSHPPEEIQTLVQKVREGADFVVGSRYIHGGSTDAQWGLLRWFNSKVATLLARGLTSIKDPMAGYFAFPRRVLNGIPPLSPVGYKIGLEILTKGRCHKVIEVPIAFAERQSGKSKLTLRQQLLYLRHLRRLYRFRFPQAVEILQFCAVGMSGVVVDLVGFLSLTYLLDFHHQVSRALSFVGAASWNWFLNRWFTFVGGRDRMPGKQWIAFLLTASIGFVINWGSYKLLTDHVPYMMQHHLMAFWIGIFLGAGFNYTFSRWFVFRPFEEALEGRKADLDGQE